MFLQCLRHPRANRAVVHGPPLVVTSDSRPRVQLKNSSSWTRRLLPPETPHRLRRNGAELRDATVGPFGMSRQHVLGRPLALAERQWEPLVDVAADELDQRVVGPAVEVPRFNPVEPEDPGRLHPMGAVDDQAVRPVHEHRRPVTRPERPASGRAASLSPPSRNDVLTLSSARATETTSAEGGTSSYCLHHRRDQRSPRNPA